MPAVEQPSMDAAKRPLVSVILPVFNEAVVLEASLRQIEEYLTTIEDRYRAEVIIVNDGSTDRTSEIAERFARDNSCYTVLHHPTNFGLGQAFKSGFRRSRGNFVVTLDVDLSYSPEHIGSMLDTMAGTRAKLVLASPYMRGGRIVDVPWMRRILSVWANRFLGVFVPGRISTLTCMTRAYDGPWIRALHLRSMNMSVMPEIIYKALVTRALMLEMPATLDWGLQRRAGRKSSMNVLRHIPETVLSSFLLRPFYYLLVPGLLLLVFALYVDTWMIIHFFEMLLPSLGTDDPLAPSEAVAIAYQAYPHTFIVGLLATMLALQLIGMGVLALQGKKYFEELFHFQTEVLRRHHED